GGAPADLPGTPAAEKAAGASAGVATAGPAALANATVAVAVAVASATPLSPPLAGAAASGDGSGPGATPATKVLPALVHRPWRHLKQAVAHLGDDPPDDALHEVRIRAKRLRYAAEAASGVMGKPARQLAVAVAAVQSELGDMQDAVVAEAWLRRHASGASPGQAMVAGQLVTLQRQEQAACRARWAKPWKAASKKKLRRWLSG
ncbi:MAG: CHAD domain-containing protein, partial [Acidimicrobiales bacterium]